MQCGEGNIILSGPTNCCIYVFKKIRWRHIVHQHWGVNLRTEISATKETNKNVTQPGIEPESLDDPSDALNHSATEPTTLSTLIL